MSIGNYWATTLGFDEEDQDRSKSAQIANVATACSPQEPLQPTEASVLEDWMDLFYKRMESREAEVAKAHTAQLHRDDEEIEKWKLIRERDEAEQRRKESDCARELQEAAEARLREEESIREHTRVMGATVGMSDTEREAWLADERELEALCCKEAKQEARLAELSAVLARSVAYLKEKEDSEIEDRRRYEQQLELDRTMAAHQAVEERNHLERLELNARSIHEAEEPLARELLLGAFFEASNRITNAARSALYECLDGVAKAKLSALSQDAANAILDDLVMLREMQKTVDKLSASPRM